MPNIRPIFLGLIILVSVVAHAQPRHFVATTRFGNGTQAYADLPAARLFIQPNALTYVLHDQAQVHENHHTGNYQPVKTHAYKTSFEGANPDATIQNDAELSFKYNFFVGNDPDQWQSNSGAFEQTTLKDIYPNTDAKLYFDPTTRHLKYDIILQPNANPRKIKIKYEGTDKIYLDPEGNLIVQTSLNNIIEQKPYAYQIINNEKVQIDCKYTINNNVVGFELKKYDEKQTLVIDPVLIFGTYSGSVADNWGFTATYDEAGNAYSGGSSFGTAYPNILGAFDGTHNGSTGDEDILISKFNPTGNQLIYYTYLGGTNNGVNGTQQVPATRTIGLDNPLSLFVDFAGNLVILGKTVASNYPTTATAFDRTLNSNNDTHDIVISKLSPNGAQLLASTYIGGSQDDGHNAFSARYSENDQSTLNYNYGDYSRGEILSDSSNNYYVAINTKSSNFPTTNAFQNNNNGGQDGVVFKINTNLSALIYSTYIGGNDEDAAYSIALDPQNGVYVTGGTQSSNFPTTIGTHQRTFGGVTDGFLAHINASGNTLLQSTYVGTPKYDQSYFVKLDYDNRPYVTGQTEGSFPVSPNTWNVVGGKQFICRYSKTLNQRTLSTIFGSGGTKPDISPTAFLIDICNNIYVSGWGGEFNQAGTGTSGLPIFGNPIRSTTDGKDFYLIVLDSNARTPIYATFFGGNLSSEHVDGGTSRFDRTGTVYQAVCAGCNSNDDFPTTPNAFSRTNGSANCNLGLFKLDFQLVPANAQLSVTPTSAKGCVPFTVSFQNLSSPNATYAWDFGDGTPVVGGYNVPPHTYSQIGTYYCKLLVFNCRGADTTTQIIRVFPPPVITTNPSPAICPETDHIISANGGQNYSWAAGTNGRIISGASTRTPTIRIRSSAWFYVTGIDSNGCSATDSILIRPKSPLYSFNLNDTTFNICVGESLTLYPFIDPTRLASWSWIPVNGITNPNQLAQTITPKAPTTYYIQGTTLDSCYVLDSLTITPRYDVFANAGLDKAICINDSITLTATGGLRYVWNTGDTTATIRVAPTDTIQYWVVAYKGLCESRADTINIFVNDILPDFKANLDTGYAPQIVRFTNLSLGANTYLWDFGNGITTNDVNPSYLYKKTGKYSVTLYAINDRTGCIDSITRIIVIDTVTLNVPNIITINNDNLNDDFRIFTVNMREVVIDIYNRWGELIYTTTDLNARWNAIVREKRVPNGTYVVIINGIGKNDQPYRYIGTLSVVK